MARDGTLERGLGALLAKDGGPLMGLDYNFKQFACTL